MRVPGYTFEVRAECPACGSTNISNRYRSSFEDPAIGSIIKEYYKIDPAILSAGEYVLDQCNSCSTIYQAQVGDNSLLSTLYGDWLCSNGRPEDDPGYAYDMAHPLKSRDAHEIMAASSYLGKPLEEMTTLDYGMGWASWARVASVLGCQSFGSDIATDRMAFAHDHGVVPLQEKEIGEQRFDFINTEQAMEHMTAPSAVTKRLAAALKPGGILKISVPSQHHLELAIAKLNQGHSSIDRAELSPAHPLEHVNSFTSQGLAAMGARFGLKPVRPDLSARYAFLTRRSTLDYKDVKRLMKELVRPAYQYRNPTNLYLWLQRPL